MIKLALCILINVSIIMFAGWTAWFAYQIGMCFAAPLVCYCLRVMRAKRQAPAPSAKRSAPVYARLK